MSYLPHAFIVLMGGVSLLTFATSDRLQAQPPVARIADALAIEDSLVRACFDEVRPCREDVATSKGALATCLQSRDQSLHRKRVLDVLRQNRPGAERG